MDSLDLFDIDASDWKEKSTTEQISDIGDDLPRLAVNVVKYIEELEQTIEESEEDLKMEFVWKNTKAEVVKLFRLSDFTNDLLDQLQQEQDWETSHGLESVIEDSVNEVDWDRSINDSSRD